MATTSLAPAATSESAVHPPDATMAIGPSKTSPSPVSSSSGSSRTWAKNRRVPSASSRRVRRTSGSPSERCFDGVDKSLLPILVRHGLRQRIGAPLVLRIGADAGDGIGHVLGLAHHE